MGNKNLSIIIVDDLQFSRIVVKAALKKAGYNGVRMANSATEALSMMELQPADVLLADWMMPEMDGLELTQHVRQRDEEKGTYTAIILFTANNGVDFLVKAFEHGVDDYLCKPPNPLELSARVNAAARIASLQNNLLETSRQLQSTIKNLEKIGLVDELTGAGNLNFLMKMLKAQLEEVAVRKGGVSLVLIELRELKSIQKKHGKKIADEVVVGIYRRLRHIVRPTDTVAKLNKNIFALAMRFTRIDDFQHVTIERILDEINTRAYKTAIGTLNVTACMGVHFYSSDGSDTDIMKKLDAEQMFTLTQNNLNKVRKDNTQSIIFGD